MHVSIHESEWGTTGPGSPMKKIRVMIVEEHLAVRRALAARLASFSQIEVVATARNLQEGQEVAPSCLPDVILLELKGKNSKEIDPVKEMNNALTENPARVIVLTSYADAEEQQAALQAGARRYLLKNIDSASLIAEIEAVVKEGASPGSQAA